MTGRMAYVGVVVALVAAAPAVAKAPRIASAPYTTAGGVAGVITGDTDVNGTHYGVATIHTRRGESRVELAVTDDAGLPVAFEVAQDTDGDGHGDAEFGAFCGKTGAPLRLKRQRADLMVFILAGPCGSGVSAPTTGTVTARLA